MSSRAKAARQAAQAQQAQHEAVAAWHSQGYASMAPPSVGGGRSASGVGGGGQGGSGSRRRGEEANEKALSQREKNREAVRNCRKRKKEHAQQLKERVDELIEENAKLRLELQLGAAAASEAALGLSAGGASATSSVLSGYQHGGPGGAPAGVGLGEEQELIAEMQALVKKAHEEEQIGGSSGGSGSGNANKARRAGAAKSEAEMALRRKVQVYMERHQDHGRDRQKAIGFILGRLQRLVEPEVLTKQYLQMMTVESAPGSEADLLTKKLMAELELTAEQQQEFNKRVRYAKRLRTELDCAFEKMESIVKRCRRNKKVGDSLNELTTILKPEQFARFVVWVHSNPACKDILDELWGKLLTKCDLQINDEILSSPSAVDQIKRFQENSAALAIHLFSIAGSRAREKIAKLCVHPEVVLVDANNNVDKRGVREVTRYMSFVTKAFDTQACEKTKALRAFDGEELSIVSDQQDDKVTGTWRLSGVYIGRLRPRKKGGDQGSSSSSGGAWTESPATPFGFNSTSINVPENGFSLPSSVVGGRGTFSRAANSGAGGTSENGNGPGFWGSSPRHGSPSMSSMASTPSGAPEPLLTKEEQKARTVSFNVIVEFSFADPTKPELITEMIISWDAMSLVGQLGLLKSPKKGVLPPPNLEATNSNAANSPGAIPPLSLDGNPAASGPAMVQGATSTKIDDNNNNSNQKQGNGMHSASQDASVASSQQSAPSGNGKRLETSLANSTENHPGGSDSTGSVLNLDAHPSTPLSACEAQEARAAALRRRNAANLARLFQAELASERERLAEEILDTKCMFDDIHMGVKYKGIPACLTYLRRLRRAFPTFTINATVVREEMAFPPRTKVPVHRRVSSSSSDASSTTSSRSSVALNDKILEVKWEITGFYGGALVQEPKPCKFDGRIFVSTNPNTSKVSYAKLDIVAQDLMFQLGVLQKPM